MSVTIATTPQYPAIGKTARVDFTLSGVGNYLKGFFTDAPIDSDAKAEIIKTGARVPAFDVDSNKPWLFEPDAGGVYTIQIEQYTKGVADFGGGYQGSPDGFPTETLTDSSTVTLAVGQKVTQKVGFGADVATLTLFIVGDTVRATSFDQNGFPSPLITDPKTPKANTAALNSDVVSAVAGLAGQDTTFLLGTVQTAFNTMIVAFQNHAQSVTYHDNADVDNNPSSADLMSTPPSPEGIKRSVGRFLTLLDQHMRDDDGAGGGSGSKHYHVGNRADWANALLATNAGDVLDTFTALADCWRAYIGHCANTIVHLVADATNNVPASLPPLLALHALFLTQLQQQSPTAPASVNAGVTALIHGAGFEEA